MSAATDFDASDLHVIAGVPPAFRVNGEIILADNDALTEQEVEAMAFSLLNEQQKAKFEQEWELCISLVPHRREGACHFLSQERAPGNELPILWRPHFEARRTGAA